MISTNVVDVTGYDAKIFCVETLGEMVKRIRDSRGWSQQKLAALAGFGPHVIWGLEKGRQKTVKSKNIEGLANALGVEVSAIVDSMNQNETQDNVSAAKSTADDRRPVPLYHFVPANRVGGPEDFYAEQQDYEPQMTVASVTSARCMVIVLDGDCMEPQFPHGAKMLVDWDAVEKDGMKEGDFYFVRTRGEENGRCTFKQYIGKDKSGKHQFRCLNPKYPGVIRFKGEFDAARAMHRIL